jgi:hypothetical protein
MIFYVGLKIFELSSCFSNPLALRLTFLVVAVVFAVVVVVVVVVVYEGVVKAGKS